jgi:parvulin-like peptidyl-prolyl isomerase
MPQPQNKKFLAQKQREERQKKIIIIGTITVLVIVFGLITYGIVDRFVLKPNTAVLTLNSKKVTAIDFEQRIRYERFRSINEVYQMLEFIQSLGGTPEVFNYFGGQIMSAVNKLEQPSLIGQEVLQNMSDELIILVEAEKMGIEVEDSQVEAEIQQLFGFFPEGSPTPEPTIEIQPTSTLTSLQQTLIPPTATTELEDEEEQENPPTNTPEGEESPQEEPDPTPTLLLQPTEYTAELYQENYQDYLDVLSNEGIKEETFWEIVRVFMIQRKIFNEITKDIPNMEEQVWARHILVEDEETANEVAEKLADGEDFVELAATYSVDTSNKDLGGDLGWFGRGMMVATFEEVAFALEVGEISEPLETSFGWHIIQSLGKEQRQIDQSTYDQARNAAFGEWLLQKRTEYQVETNENWMEYIPTEPVLPQAVLDYLMQVQSGMQAPLPTAVPQQ